MTGATGDGRIVLRAQKVSKRYRVADRTIPVLEEIDFTAKAGQFITITGSSGSGKTTLLSLLSGLDRPTSGSVYLKGREISAFTEERMAPLRNRWIGFVFQSFHLIPSLTARENVLFPAELAGDADAPARARNLMQRMQLDHLARHFPHQLSGGEKQRFAIIRALINRPEILFADEPTGNLDDRNGRAVLELLMELRLEYGATLLLVTHNRDIAVRCDRVLTLAEGAIAC